MYARDLLRVNAAGLSSDHHAQTSVEQLPTDLLELIDREWLSRAHPAARNELRGLAESALINELGRLIHSVEQDRAGSFIVSDASPPAESRRLKRVERRRAQSFPRCAAWLRQELHARGLEPADLQKYHGPDRKTVIKILDGGWVREGSLQKLANSLSEAPISRKRQKVELPNIPSD